MALRPFWMEAKVEGRKTDIETGPRGKFDEMTIKLYQRNDGCKKATFTISCFNCTDRETGRLMLVTQILNSSDNSLVSECTTLY